MGSKPKVVVITETDDGGLMLERVVTELGYPVLRMVIGKDRKWLQECHPSRIVIIAHPSSARLACSLVNEISGCLPQSLVVCAVGEGDTDVAVSTMKAGAFDILLEPVSPKDVEKVLVQGSKYLQVEEMNRADQYYQKVFPKTLEEESEYFQGMIGSSFRMQELFFLVRKAADCHSTVLIQGESGTGKELVARAVHNLSPRREHPLVPVNCGAIPEDLLESELFGHVKGAFTGAISSRPGRFQVADKGTIFLDEIGNMSLRLQVKLLRAIQEMEFEPVGSMETVKVDVRVIAATNVDLEKAVKEGTFREDLFYRLDVIPVNLPPLRERRSDIPSLVNHFLARYSQRMDRPPVLISQEAFRRLMIHSWAGNVRELENTIERLVTLNETGVIEVDELPEKIKENIGADSSIPDVVIPQEGLSLNEVMDNFETRLLHQALDRTGWNKNQAAKLLMLNRTTLVAKLRNRGWLGNREVMSSNN